MTELNRRTALAAPLATAALLQAATASAQQTSSPVVTDQRALPFDPNTVAGLSARMLISHHDNNYAGAVRRLGAIQTQLGALDFSAAPGFTINGLKREELIALNSMILHEVYFAGLGGDAQSPDRRLGAQIEQDFGSFDRWRSEFVGMGKALGGGSGWVLLTWSPRAGRLMNTWAADHTMTGADGAILVALDMYEHAYAIDYGAAAAGYVDAFMGALRWNAASHAFAGRHSA